MELWITRCVVQRGALARNGLFFVKTPKSMFILILCMFDIIIRETPGEGHPAFAKRENFSLQKELGLGRIRVK